MDIQHERANSRFSIDHDGQKSVLSYLMQGEDHIHFIRTWVAPAYRGSGHGAGLVRAGLDHARELSLSVSSSCWFVDEFVARNPQYAGLMSEDR
ncbi:MAG: N-acetyltransferase [Gemmatimonadetes bacterium]|nr:N-acetyltransferase [Gemmatimonadota bacterium]NNF12119.1 N-acetyltransferase [Gemmatimonadota bacterium]